MVKRGRPIFAEAERPPARNGSINIMLRVRDLEEPVSTNITAQTDPIGVGPEPLGPRPESNLGRNVNCPHVPTSPAAIAD
jgi:hypothetical protein